MLKKKNILVAIFSFLFCCSMFAGSVAIKNENVMQNTAFAEDIAFPEDSANWDGEKNSESDTWYFDGDSTVTLAGSIWFTPLYLPEQELTINLIGENEIETTEANAIVYAGTSLTFTGTGSLKLTSASSVFSFVDSSVVSFSDLDVTNEEGEEVNVSEAISLNKITIGTVPAGIAVEISGEDKETTYDGSFYNLSSMFEFDESVADVVNYSIVSDGTTGAGNITGCMLEITKCGVFNIEISVDGTKHTQTLTVNKANLPVGDDEGQTQIVVKGYDSNDVEVPYIYPNGWSVGEIDYIESELINNVGGGEIYDYSYYYYASDGSGSMIFNGQDLPKDIEFDGGRYVIRVVVDESDLYVPAMIEKTFLIKSPIDYFIPQNIVNVEYNDLDEGVFDLSTLFEIDDEYLDSISSVTYKLTSNVLEEPLILNNSSFEINSISENVDSYNVEIVINAKPDGFYCSSNKFNVELNVEKSNVTGFDIQFHSKVYDGEPITFDVTENIYDLSYTIKYYKDVDTLLDDVPAESGRYYAEITISGNEVFKETLIYRDFTIGQTVIEIIWQEDDFTYNGSAQIIRAYYINHEGQEVPLIVQTDRVFRDVQIDGVDYEYTAFATFDTFDDRFTLPDETVNRKTYHIKPMELEVEVLDRTKAFGSSSIPNFDVKIVKGKVFVGDERPALWELRVNETIDSETPVGSYEIIATATNANPNYNVTFTNTAYLRVTNAILTTDMIQDWTWGDEPNTPYAESALGEVQFFYYQGETQLSSVPTEPGVYRLIARVGENESDPNYAEFEEMFIIDKIIVNIPREDTTEYIYNGALQSYKVLDSDLENAALYTVGNREFRDAGIHQVELKIEDDDFVYYRWPNGQQVYYMNFEIKKKPVSKPEADNRVHKYNGKAITYALASSEDYVISENTTQTNVGRYKVIVSLRDTNNTTWADGTVDNLVYNFVINQGRIDNPVIKDANGNAVNTKDVTIIDVSGNGLNPESILQVDIVKSGDEKIDKTKNQLSSVLSKYDKIFKVADIKLVQYGVSVQPENRITLKMLVPEELRTANFTLYHIHTNENGEEIVSEIEYSKVDKDGFITFQTDKLSSFAFVYEQSSLKTSIVIFSVLSGIMLILLIAQVVFFILKKKSKAKVLAAAAPVFFVKSEVSATIALGSVCGLLLIANIVMLVFNILAYKSKKCEEKKSQPKAKQKSKPAESKKA